MIGLAEGTSMSTPKALNTEAQGKRHELRECRATLSYESNESSVEPTTLQQRATLPRPKQAAGGFRPRSRAAPTDTARLGRSCFSFRNPGWRSIRYRESPLTLGFGVQRLRRSCCQSSLAGHGQMCNTTRTCVVRLLHDTASRLKIYVTQRGRSPASLKKD